MTKTLIFWAQALDNTSSDHFDFQGEELRPDDMKRRQEAVSLVSSVIKTGARIFESQGVLLTVNSHYFVVEVPSAQRDRAGRTAPVVCYGDYDASFGDTFGTSVAAGLDNFAKRIGRTLLSEHFELVRESFITLKKKSMTMRLILIIWIGALGLVLLAAVYWLAQKSW